MKRLAIKKLIVISQSESRSLEVPFENGLNIILGGNKTGKSSIIKSIFTTLGCECKRIETDWKKLISAYLLFFKYGEKQFCVVRQGKKFQIFENNEDSYSCIIETETFHEYSNCLHSLEYYDGSLLDSSLYIYQLGFQKPLVYSRCPEYAWRVCCRSREEA